jgi:hypothetical protein
VSTTLKPLCPSSEKHLTIPYLPSCCRKSPIPLPATRAPSSTDIAVATPVFPPPPVPSLHGEHPSGPTCPASPLQCQHGHPTHARLVLVRHVAAKLAATTSSAHSRASRSRASWSLLLGPAQLLRAFWSVMVVALTPGPAASCLLAMGLASL